MRKPVGVLAVVVLGGGLVAIVLPGSGLLLLGVGAVVLLIASASQSTQRCETQTVQVGADVVSPRRFQAILTLGLGLVVLSFPLTLLHLSPVFVLVPGVVLLVCASALAAFGKTPTTHVGQRLASGLLVCLLVLPFVVVGFMILVGADAMAIFLVGYFVFLLVVVCAACVLLMLVGLQGVRIGRQRRTGTPTGSS